MRYTCSLDVAEEYPTGLTERSVGLLLGVTEKAARDDIDRAMDRWRLGLACDACEAPAGEPCDVPGGLHAARGRAGIAAVLGEARREREG